MSSRLTWVDFLNESATWETVAQADSFWSKLVGTTLRLSASEISELGEFEFYMRDQINALHFGRTLKVDFLNQKLSTLRMQLAFSTDVDGEAPLLPVLKTIRARSNSPIQEIMDTWLLQFANFLGSLSDGSPPYLVNRCAAIYRKGQVADCKSFYKKFRSLEQTWRAEAIPDLENPHEVEGEFERCADFFVASRFGKFCSDACRFNSFALRKQTQSPNYQAEKQRRYRERQKLK